MFSKCLPKPAVPVFTTDTAAASVVQIRQLAGSQAVQLRVAQLRDQLARDEKAVGNEAQRLPPWLRVSAPASVPSGEGYHSLRTQLSGLHLHTVCQEARCPNISECWNTKHPTATIMLLGRECTRACRFCAVATNLKPAPPDHDEPENTATSIANWTNVSYVVLTTVDRDDLEDSGAGHIAKTVRLVLQKRPGMLVEVLTGDFKGRLEDVETVVASGLKVFAHNVETVEQLTPFVRDKKAQYRQSLGVLAHAKKTNPKVYTKSSIMLGLGESKEQVDQTLKDLREHGVDVVTLGQYMRPTRRHLKVHEYITPESFEYWRTRAQELGFLYAASGPLVRSSYRAGEVYMQTLLTQKDS